MATTIATPTREQLLAMVWGNGGNCPPTIEFHSDGGHGWLKCPKKLAKELGFEPKISRYSYQHGEYYWLEEDCDMGLFVRAAGIVSDDNPDDRSTLQMFWEVCPQQDYNDDAPCRRYSHVQGHASSARG